MRKLYIMKAKDISLKEIWLQHLFGRKIEPLEPGDFSMDNARPKGEQ